ncbi:MAG TPA: PQQ-dependent sugar dehydrogenase [Puia sp.]|nr:PQQ-dependent sugar dehydrogenase [Puia sp.]
MKNGSAFSCYVVLCLCLSLNTIAQKTATYYNQTFKIDTLYPATGSTGMNSPWEVVYGPDDSLWVTEAHNYKIWKIHPGNKGARMLLNLNSEKDFTNPTSWPQGGLMGLAIHPQFFSGKPWVYIAYVYHLIGCGSTACGGCASGACSFNTKLVRCEYDFTDGSLSILDTVITGLHGSNDHNSGRIRISPLPESDGKYHLYYTIGDMGAGNLANANRPNHAQDTTIIEGKTLRLNAEPDLTLPASQKWIPGDNPFPQGAAPAAKTPIYSFGHRNPQGLVFGSVNGGASYILYSSEHGDKSDDEVNVILPHANYGWPKVAGFCDDNYTSSNGDSMYLANKSVISEKGFCDTTPTTLVEPLFSFYHWPRDPNNTAGALSNNNWPTIAPSSIAFYGAGAIPGWNYSLLVPSLKNGMFRLKLKPDGLSVDNTSLPTDTLHYLAGLRLRNVTIAPTGDTLFVSVDNSCCAIDSAGNFGTAANPEFKGFILRMVYLTTLALHDTVPAIHGENAQDQYKVWPNPATRTIYIKGKTGARLPLFAQLYDITGKPVMEKTAPGDDFSLDVQGLVPGIYILRISNGYGIAQATEKITIL